MEEKVLEIRNLKTQFNTYHGPVVAVNDISFDLCKGKIMGIVGESGSGKSTVALSIMRIIDETVGKVIGGQVLLNGEDIMTLPEEKMRTIRGNKISMIFQDPMTSLNPVFTIGNQIQESIILHQGMSYRDAVDKSIELLNLVSMPAAEKRINEYPHQLSGGMRQRVMIAMALACSPKLLIADEPTTALDVTIQAQILDLLQKIQEETQMSILLITHDLGVVAELCHKVAVMYCGQIVEMTDSKTLFESPAHPYTVGLLGSIPSIDTNFHKKRLPTIEGVVPSLLDLPIGCTFQDRCSFATEVCKIKYPKLEKLTEDREVACFHPRK
jgi:oligopeptide/dipeptide ABC transporter ATP-binding protein